MSNNHHQRVPSVSSSLSITPPLPPSSSTDENKPPEDADDVRPTSDPVSEAAWARRSAHNALYRESLSNGLSSVYGESNGGGGCMNAAVTSAPDPSFDSGENGFAALSPHEKGEVRCR